MAENSFPKFIKYQLLKLKTFFTSKNVLSFLVFLGLSTVFWFTNALDKVQETTIHVPIRYVGIPKNIVLTNLLPKYIEVLIKEQGVKLINYKEKNLTPLTVDLNRAYNDKGEILITPDQLNGRLSRFLLPTTKVLSILPDSILIKYEKLKTAVIPVHLNGKIELAQQYMFSRPIELDPSEVTVYAHQRVLDTLKLISTEFISLQELNDTIIKKIKIKPINNVEFLQNDIKLTVYVEMFTEKVIQLPVTSINCPSGLKLKTFPAIVNVSFNIGISHYNESISDELKVVIDYRDIQVDGNGRQKLKIINNSEYLTNIKIDPEDIEFIIETN